MDLFFSFTSIFLQYLSTYCSLFLQTFVQKENDLYPHVFKEKLFHWFCNKRSILSLLEFLGLFQLPDFNNKVCNELFVCFPNQLLHYHSHNENSNINKFFHVTSNFSFKHAIFSSFLSLFLHYHSSG
jgi:hypothetical protein